MRVLANNCNATFVFAPLAPPLANCENVDPSDNDSCSSIIVFILKQYEQ